MFEKAYKGLLALPIIGFTLIVMLATLGLSTGWLSGMMPSIVLFTCFGVGIVVVLAAAWRIVE